MSVPKRWLLPAKQAALVLMVLAIHCSANTTRRETSSEQQSTNVTPLEGDASETTTEGRKMQSAACTPVSITGTNLVGNKPSTQCEEPGDPEGLPGFLTAAVARARVSRSTPYDDGSVEVIGRANTARRESGGGAGVTIKFFAVPRAVLDSAVAGVRTKDLTVPGRYIGATTTDSDGGFWTKVPFAYDEAIILRSDKAVMGGDFRIADVVSPVLTRSAFEKSGLGFDSVGWKSLPFETPSGGGAPPPSGNSRNVFFSGLTFVIYQGLPGESCQQTCDSPGRDGIRSDALVLMSIGPARQSFCGAIGKDFGLLGQDELPQSQDCNHGSGNLDLGCFIGQQNFVFYCASEPMTPHPTDAYPGVSRFCPCNK